MAQATPLELARLLTAGDPAAHEAAWTEFVRAHSRLLLHAARVIGRDYDAAMDAYAYVLEQLRADDHRRLRAYAADGRSKFTTWLVVVARRLCLDHHRQRYGRARDPGNPATEARAVRRRLADLVAEEIDPVEIQAPNNAAPDAGLEVVELSVALASALGELAPRDRLLLALRFEDDHSAREIARLMGFPTPFHVYRRLRTVLTALRLALGGRGVDGANPQ